MNSSHSKINTDITLIPYFLYSHLHCSLLGLQVTIYNQKLLQGSYCHYSKRAVQIVFTLQMKAPLFTYLLALSMLQSTR